MKKFYNVFMIVGPLVIGLGFIGLFFESLANSEPIKVWLLQGAMVVVGTWVGIDNVVKLLDKNKSGAQKRLDVFVIAFSLFIGGFGLGDLLRYFADNGPMLHPILAGILAVAGLAIGIFSTVKLYDKNNRLSDSTITESPQDPE